MSYCCLDCGHVSRGKFPHGKCPACRSYRVKSQFEKIHYHAEKSRKHKLQSMIMLILWAALLYGAWDRYAKPWFITEQAKPIETPMIYDKTEAASNL